MSSTATLTSESTEDYNPDVFDWQDDKDGINLEEIDNDSLLEDVFAAALGAYNQAFDWTYVRKSELRERAGRMYVVKVVMPLEHREWFETEWPEYVFVWDKATRHHDHPVSHLCTELNEIEMTAKLVSDGTPYIDLFGNGQRDAKYKRKALVLFMRNSSKDYLRYFDADKNTFMREIDWERLYSGGYRWGSEEINEICLTHALYYLKMDAIGRWVNSGPKKRIRALVHRHQHTHGFLNRGEQEYRVSEQGIVTQMNVDTGEPYHHPSMEALFHQFNAKTKHGGVAWTVTRMGGDTYQFEFVSCEVDKCRDFVPLLFLKPETRTEWAFNDTTVRSFLGWTWMTTKTGNTQYLLEDCDLTDKLRRYIAGKPRNARNKSELMNYARRLTNKADIIAIHGGGAHEVLVGRMSDYVENAFYMDARHELEVALSYWRRNETVIKALNVYYEKGEMPADMVKVKKALAVGAKCIVSPLHWPGAAALAAAVGTTGVGLPVIATVGALAVAASSAAVGMELWDSYAEPSLNW